MIRKRWFLFTALLSAVLFLGGCKALSSIKPGQFVAKADVQQAFEACQVNPSYLYYYSGPDAYPIAIIGIDRNVNFDTAGLWKPVKNPSEQLAGLIKSIQDRALGLLQFVWGYSLLDNTGKQIGVWYSIPSAVTTVLVKEDGTVMVYTPPLDTYLKLERETR